MSKQIETVSESHLCENCGVVTLWVGDTSLTNIGGFSFLFCEGCGLATVEGLE